MAVDKKDIEDVAEALGKKFDEFKKTNDKRIDGLEEEKGKLSGQVDTLNEKLGELDALKSSLEKELISFKRPDGTGTKAASEHKANLGSYFGVYGRTQRKPAGHPNQP